MGQKRSGKAVELEGLRPVAERLLEDPDYLSEVREIARTTLGDAANELDSELNDPRVKKLAEEILIGRLLASAGGRLSLGQMKAGACDCCKWEAAIAGSLVINPVDRT